MKNKNHSFGEKIKEIFIEILIILFAVTLSIWLHGWSEHRHQQAEVVEFLSDLRGDLKKDVNSIKEQKKSLEDYLEFLGNYKKMLKTNPDSVDDFTAVMTDRDVNSGNYEGFKSSGKIVYIENKNVKKMILEYYQQSIPVTKKFEEFSNKKSLETFEFAFTNEFNKSYLKGLSFQMRVELVEGIAKGLMKKYDEDIKLADSIITEITKEIS